MFIRTKSIKGHKYAYLVKNRWYKRKKSPKQKVQKYIGRVYKLDIKKELTFQEHIKKDLQEYLNNSSTNEIFLDLVRFELKRHGFKEKNTHFFTFKNIVVDLKETRVYNTKTNKEICIEMNQGFLSTHTINNLLNFKFPEGLDLEIGKTLGNTILSTGVLIDNKLFITIFQKLYTKQVKPIKLT